MPPNALDSSKESSKLNYATKPFGTADWGNKEKFSDELLKDLIEGFSEMPLGNLAVSTDAVRVMEWRVIPADQFHGRGFGRGKLGNVEHGSYSLADGD